MRNQELYTALLGTLVVELTCLRHEVTLAAVLFIADLRALLHHMLDQRHLLLQVLHFYYLLQLITEVHVVVLDVLVILVSAIKINLLILLIFIKELLSNFILLRLFFGLLL